MIQAHNVCLSFGKQVIFDDVSFTINDDQRIGLVGRNGSGKSTLLKAIAQQQHLDNGSIASAKNKKIAYMPQEVVLISDKSILDETLTAYVELQTIRQEIHDLEKKLQINADTGTVERYGHLQQQLIELNPGLIEAQTKEILQGLGFKAAQMQEPVSNLSVGWKMRVVMAKLLLQNADFYLFDEPTNHLDIVAKDWFLDFLRRSHVGFLLVSHERYFLDALCTEILELELGKATFYTGNYSQYVVQKEHNLGLLQSAYALQQKEIKQKTAFVERFRASASRAKSAQSALKQLEKIELIKVPPSPKTASFSFPPVIQPGKTVLEVNNLSCKFGEKEIFKNVSFSVERGEKVAVVAANGAGKTTLFNIIAGKVPKQSGSIKLGYNVDQTIFAQDQAKALDGNKTVFDNVVNAAPKKTEKNIRTMLGTFLFSNDDIYKKVSVLSGGEKNRVGMICVLLKDANFLLLDEPTNHLDIPSKEILLSALQAYQGTVLFVSHDHDFINHLATRIIELTPTGVVSYHGNYESYLEQKKHAQLVAQEIKYAQPTKTAKAPTDNKTEQELRKKSKKLEAKIEKLETEIKIVEHLFATLEYGKPEFAQAQERLQGLKNDLENSYAEWESVQTKLS